ncbi:rod shape-determining protein MreD [Eubacterium oxidoreducens]|uniref:Rod shape-determining protein MreD n=1 Tax=Eubacterium oxidoreducens TaxID=1732 RepID=A0A1G6ALE9_EUBOX|nr:rod shape-determining protein MreD [Eubacterium oxidoreducens]SDB09226.1 rod shape-determining protein MreD [Eubacterium oxidoreducens]
MRRIITVIIIIIACFLLQVTLFQSLEIASISPNLLIVVVSAFGFMRGRKEGMIIGFFCGLLIDIFYGEILGFYALIYLYIGFMNGLAKKLFYPDDIKLPMLLIACSDFGLNIIIYFFQFLFRNQTDFGYYLAHIIVPELLYTIIITLVLYFILLKVNTHLEKIEKRSAKKFV